MSSTTNIIEEPSDKEENVISWKSLFQFPVGAKLLMFYQLVSGMENYCFLLSMPIYMTSILRFSDTMSTTIYHARSGLGMILNIFGAILADSFLGRSKTYLGIFPFYLVLLSSVVILSIYTEKIGIIICYFLMAIVGGLVKPAIRTFISDQIPQDNKVMLGTYIHIIYLINNFGIIIMAYSAPIMHKDIYCFGMECYPLVFLVALLLACLAFTLVFIGFLLKLFVIYKATDNLLLNIFSCLYLAVKKRIALGKPSQGLTWLDYSNEKFDAPFIKDIKIAKGLLIFLLAHPLFWTVFEQISSIWTLQAQYMDGMVSEHFVIKADQMQTLNPILVVLLIPIFELWIYPCLTNINFKVPYRIMSGQIFTALACLSMIFIQLRIDSVIDPKLSGGMKINIVNLVHENLSLYKGSESFTIPQWSAESLVVNRGDMLTIKVGKDEWNVSARSHMNKIMSAIIFQDKLHYNLSSSEVERQTNGGYANVRIFNRLEFDFEYSVLLKARVGINKDFTLTANRNQFGIHSKCGIGLFDIYFQEKVTSIKRKLGEITLHPAEAKTLIITGNHTTANFTAITECRFYLPTIIWQVIPYLMVTIGEVLFNVNTGIFLYGEAPLSMKSMLLAAEYTCIALGNFLILILNQFLRHLSMIYLFIICGCLVALSGVFTGILGYFYLKYQSEEERRVLQFKVSIEF